MDIAGSTALVTGSNRGLGRHFAPDLLARGATKVYATARRSETVDLPGVVPLAVDVADPESIATAAVATDVDLLVINAGISTRADLLTGDLADFRREMDVHYFGTLQVVRAFPLAPSRPRGARGSPGCTSAPGRCPSTTGAAR